jgi:calcineurin-like phosphoesterase family protein
MNKIFIISDTHFFHDNIIKYCNRPFDDIDSMNHNMIHNWNNTVSRLDTVYHLGDVTFGSFEKTKELMFMLNGKKILIKGNHDKLSDKQYNELGFNKIYDHPIILESFYILSHKPMFISCNMPYRNICGHVHDMELQKELFYNVSVEKINYTPIPFDTIKKEFKESCK